MCGCEPGFVCTRCKDTPEDWHYWTRREPESSQEEADRIRSEYVALVVEPVLRRAA